MRSTRSLNGVETIDNPISMDSTPLGPVSEQLDHAMS